MPPEQPACAHELASPPCSPREALVSADQGVRLPVVLEGTGAVVGLQKGVHVLLENRAACSLHFDRSHNQIREEEEDRVVEEPLAWSRGALGSGDARLQGRCGVQEEFGMRQAVELRSSCLAAIQAETCVCGRQAWLSACGMELNAATGHFSPHVK